MASPKKRYDICAGRPYGDDKKHWINVGRLTEWDDGGLSIELHTVPVGAWFDGRLSVFEQKDREQGGTSSSGGRGGAPNRQRPARAVESSRDDAPLDDDIPFVTNRSQF